MNDCKITARNCKILCVIWTLELLQIGASFLQLESLIMPKTGTVLVEIVFASCRTYILEFPAVVLLCHLCHFFLY